MADIDNIPYGSTIFVIHKGFLPNAIRRFMSKYAKQIGREPLPYNHTETVVPYQGEKMSMGARSTGAEMTPLAQYLAEHTNHVIHTPIQPLSMGELLNLEAYAYDVCHKNKRKYQYLMFLAWIIKIWSWSKLQLGNMTDKRVYCYELAARCSNVIHRWPYAIRELISIYDLWDNPNYTKLEK